ncbi:MAG: hypothetical protein IJ176_08970 [Prevotella sp.]|nr:hypothetical protein [Prevotella sp.]
MKKFFSVIALAATAMLASCNLFIEDEQEELTHGLDLNKKTVYKGDGWSEPKTETGEGYTITYQYYDNVKLLDEETQRYIANIEVEENFGCLGIINFREDTPEAMLPRIGEIVTIRPNDEFPYGYYAEVMAAGFDEGYYCVATCAVDADKVFKYLGGEITSAAFQDAEIAQSRENTSTTRASGLAEEGAFDISEDDVEISLEEETEDLLKGTFTIPISAKVPLTKIKLNKNSRTKKKTSGVVFKDNDWETMQKWSVSGSNDNGEIVGVHNLEGFIEFKKEETKMKHEITLNIKQDDLLRTLYLDFSDNIQTDGIAHIKGGISWEKSFEITKSITTKVLKAGPLGIRIIFGGGASIEAGLFGSINVEFSTNAIVKG